MLCLLSATITLTPYFLSTFASRRPVGPVWMCEYMHAYLADKKWKKDRKGRQTQHRTASTSSVTHLPPPPAHPHQSVQMTVLARLGLSRTSLYRWFWFCLFVCFLLFILCVWVLCLFYFFPRERAKNVFKKKLTAAEKPEKVKRDNLTPKRTKARKFENSPHFPKMTGKRKLDCSHTVRRIGGLKKN